MSSVQRRKEEKSLTFNFQIHIVDKAWSQGIGRKGNSEGLS